MLTRFAAWRVPVAICLAAVSMTWAVPSIGAEADHRPALYCRLSSAPQVQANPARFEGVGRQILGVAFEPQNQTLQDVTKVEVFDPSNMIEDYNVVEFSAHPKERTIQVLWSNGEGNSKSLELQGSAEDSKMFWAVLRNKDSSGSQIFEKNMVGVCEIIRSTDSVVAIDFIRRMTAKEKK